MSGWLQYQKPPKESQGYLNNLLVGQKFVFQEFFLTWKELSSTQFCPSVCWPELRREVECILHILDCLDRWQRRVGSSADPLSSS